MRAFVKSVHQHFFRFRSSALVLIIANAVPLLGVLFWNWSAFEVVGLYWAENVVMGLIYVLKMITCQPRPARVDWDQPFTPEELLAVRKRFDLTGLKTDELEEVAQLESAVESAGKADQEIALPSGIEQPGEVVFMGAFYAGACVLHGMFVADVFGRDGTTGWSIATVVTLARTIYNDCFWPVVLLAASHLYSFAVNYLGGGEYRRVTVGSLIFQPFPRVVLLHLAIMGAGFLFILFGSLLPLLVLLVVGKTALDLLLHQNERAQNARVRSSATTAGDTSAATVEADRVPANPGEHKSDPSVGELPSG